MIHDRYYKYNIVKNMIKLSTRVLSLINETQKNIPITSVMSKLRDIIVWKKFISADCCRRLLYCCGWRFANKLVPNPPKPSCLVTLFLGGDMSEFPPLSWQFNTSIINKINRNTNEYEDNEEINGLDREVWKNLLNSIFVWKQDQVG